MPDLKPDAWICPMCGYIHEGNQPPEECPVCGVEGSLFEPYHQAAPQADVPAPAQWRCLECGYIHNGATPPAECPVCGAPASSFEPVEAPEVNAPEAAVLKIVILGGGIAGVSAAEAARQYAPQASITLVSREAHSPYYRLNLTRYLAGEVDASQLPLHLEEWYAQNRVQLETGEAISIDPVGKTVSLKDSRKLSYNRLVLAVGAYPFVPPIPGANLRNVTTLRTRQDAETLIHQAQPGNSCVCIGGGLLGLEAAGALTRRGMSVTVIENQAWLLPRQLNENASRLFQQQAEALGIRVFTNARIRELVGEGMVQGVLLEVGTLLPADLVVISAGVRSQVDLARQAALEVKMGVLVNDAMQTSNAEIFAAGDMAEHNGILYGTWGPAQVQGAVAGANAVGQSKLFSPLPRSNTLKVLGSPLFSAGRIAATQADDRVVEFTLEGKYYWFVFSGQILAGAILLGDTSLSNSIKKVLQERVDCSSILPDADNFARLSTFLKAV